ncbi:MAG: isochorismate synthase [Sedimenticola sp.]|nr:isochorismate synthase [Sedimenticola sp.]
MGNGKTLIREIMARLQSALATLPVENAGLFSITLAAPRLRLTHLPSLEGHWFYWSKPSQGETLLGTGEALRLSATGDHRLPSLSSRFESLRQDWLQLDPDNSGFRASAFCGFAFDPADRMAQNWHGLPNAAIFFPELLLHQSGNKCAITFSFRHNHPQKTLLRGRHLLQTLLDALRQPPAKSARTILSRTAATPSDADWISQINQATSQIRRGDLDKVVPFRRISVRAGQPFNPSRLIASLDDLYPSSLLFAIRLDSSTFVSATPERLISLRDGAISCDAIGGTIGRAGNPLQDLELGRKLLNDPKSRHEHALVVQGILDSLRPHCRDLHAPERPTLKQLRNLQHLWTGIRGTLRERGALLELADSLHPTAAVSGFPSARAGHWLSEHQLTPRGWYTGAAGWIDRQDDGELAVLLRCALLNGDQAELFAGAGVTSESCPIAELQETELKFGTMLEALEHA